MQDQPEIGVAAFGLNAAPTGELTIDDERPRPVAVFFPEPLFGSDETLARLTVERFARERQVAPHERVIHELDDGGVVHPIEPREDNLA